MHIDKAAYEISRRPHPGIPILHMEGRFTPEVPKGMVWMAFHFRENNANWLTNPAFDPLTLTAEYKACAVAIEKM